jgi:endo-1,4-beta-xylanase
MKGNAPTYYRLALFVFAVLSFFCCANAFSDSELKAGEVNKGSFVGPITGKTIRYNIYLPEGYFEDDEHYPVIYHLHGLDGDENSDNEIVINAVKKAVKEEIISRPIVVFPNGYENSMWSDSKDGGKPAETNIVKELIKHVDTTYRTQGQRNSRIIQGFSMGGYGACQLAVKYPDMFSACINYDGALHNAESLSTKRESIYKEIFDNDEDYYKQSSPWENAEKNADRIRKKVAFRMVIGALGSFNEHYQKHLEEMDIESKYVQTECDHNLECLIEEAFPQTFLFISENTGDRDERNRSWSQKIKGTIHRKKFTGPITNDTIWYNIYLPEGYEDSDARYTVIYHLHGLGCDQYEGNRPLVTALEQAIEQGIVGPMIIVFPRAYGNTFYANSKNSRKPTETNVIRELIPHIDSEYRTLADREHRVIEGMSMGGFGAIEYAAKFPELFCVCINYDGGMLYWERFQTKRGEFNFPIISKEIFDNDEQYFNRYSPWENLRKNADAIRGKVGFRIVVGSVQELNERLRDFLKELDIEADYVQAECEHDLDCLIGNHWEETFAFIAEHLKSSK